MTNYATTEWNNKVVLHDAFWDLDDESKLAVLKHEEVHRGQTLWKRIFKNKECELEAYEVERDFLKIKIYNCDVMYILMLILQTNKDVSHGEYTVDINSVFFIKDFLKVIKQKLSKMLANAESEIERLK